MKKVSPWYVLIRSYVDPRAVAGAAFSTLAAMRAIADREVEAGIVLFSSQLRQSAHGGSEFRGFFPPELVYYNKPTPNATNYRQMTIRDLPST